MLRVILDLEVPGIITVADDLLIVISPVRSIFIPVHLGIAVWIWFINNNLVATIQVKIKPGW
jgi:hypothetical protein